MEPHVSVVALDIYMKKHVKHKLHAPFYVLLK